MHQTNTFFPSFLVTAGFLKAAYSSNNGEIPRCLPGVNLVDPRFQPASQALDGEETHS
jgi:hypothetical protein